MQIGGALGVAILADLVVAWQASDLAATGSATLAAGTGGLRLAFLAAAAIAATAALVAGWAAFARTFLTRRGHRISSAPAAHPSPAATAARQGKL